MRPRLRRFLGGWLCFSFPERCPSHTREYAATPVTAVSDTPVKAYRLWADAMYGWGAVRGGSINTPLSKLTPWNHDPLT